MASFIAKQMVGNQLKSVKGAIGGDEKKGADAADDEEDPEVAEARQEAEDKRKEKHRKMEDEREGLRQSIRDKHLLKSRHPGWKTVKETQCSQGLSAHNGLKKKVPEEADAMQQQEEAGRIGQKKKNPAELAAKASVDKDDDDLAKLPGNVGEITSKVLELPAKLGGTAEKCDLQ